MNHNDTAKYADWANGERVTQSKSGLVQRLELASPGWRPELRV
jgi:hypothetical protein